MVAKKQFEGINGGGDTGEKRRSLLAPSTHKSTPKIQTLLLL